ncbi:hypothetical protein Goari_019090 [Gossypium aridum]|uniref:TF-B3 domain-containing protein n=1 Tax=Gossypium aridum TaxID=34290 RepID=A0A7J8WRN3_GOSAI|nr:hypothetical protein [Gossypium aridum]
MVKVCQISWPGKRDFLVFFLVDSSMLDVFIYNRTACAKNIILAAKKPKGRPPRVSRQIEQTPNKKPRTVPRAQEVEFVSEVTQKHVSFQMAVKEYHKYYGYIPRCFVKETGMGKESITVIKDPSGGMLPMKTTVSREQVRFGCGWFQFLHGNEIAAGDTLLFEHFPNTGNFIHVQVINKGGNGNCGRLNKQANPCEDTSLAAKRPRGRPRKQIEEPPSTKYAPSTAF